MPDDLDSIGKFGAIIGAVIVIALVVILLGGGDNYLGKKTVSSDADLPPVATGAGPVR